LNIKDVRVLLLEASDRLLAAMPDRLSEAAAETLWRKKHVEVRFGAAVLDFDGARVTLKGGEVIPARTLIWAAGAKPVSLTATLGRNAAVAYLGGVAFKGFAAWVVWLIVHIIQLIGFRNKLFVLMNWAWDYFFYERAARLITKE